MLPPDRHGADDAGLVRHLAGARRAAGPCPDENALAAFAEGRGAAAARESIERHVADCPDCQEVVACVAPSATVRTLPRRARKARAVLAAAALVLVALGAHWLLRSPAPLAERLEVAARRLAAAEPDLFAGLPLSDDRLRPPRADELRGRTEVAQPGGVLLETPPAFRWAARPVSSAWRCALFDGSGREVWRTETSAPELRWPSDAAPLAPGRYVFEAVADAVAGAVEVRGAFRIADGALRDQLLAARRALAAVGTPERDLLLAQWALVRDLRDVAVEAARAAWSDPTARDLARPTLREALRRAGSSDEAAEPQTRER
ncbi:MAG: hypothetical protein IPM29_00340 [Planctomycetes bacterium]|nr:hypothetical protein [Planctomycetota bacterium]